MPGNERGVAPGDRNESEAHAASPWATYGVALGDRKSVLKPATSASRET